MKHRVMWIVRMTVTGGILWLLFSRIPLSDVVAALMAANLCVPASAQKCTHQGIKTVPSKTTYGPVQKCGTSLEVRVRGVTLRNPLNACPVFAIYEPPHDKPTPKDDFYTKPDRLVPILMIKMKCSTTWLFGWIPIPTGSACAVTGVTTIGTIQNYVEFPCERGVVIDPDEPDKDA